MKIKLVTLIVVITSLLLFGCPKGEKYNIHMSWDAPIPTDNVIITKIYQGQNCTNYYNIITVPQPNNSYVMNDLSLDDYCFSATFINSLGVESQHSNYVIFQLKK